MICADCPKEWRCLVACDDVNAELARVDREIDAVDQGGVNG
jgi:hypothetical protein